MTDNEPKAVLHLYLRSAQEALLWLEDGAEDNADMWATGEGSREDIDGSAGLLQDNPNLPPRDAAWRQTYRAQLECTARAAS